MKEPLADAGMGLLADVVKGLLADTVKRPRLKHAAKASGGPRVFGSRAVLSKEGGGAAGGAFGRRGCASPRNRSQVTHTLNPGP